MLRQHLHLVRRLEPLEQGDNQGRRINAEGNEITMESDSFRMCLSTLHHRRKDIELCRFNLVMSSKAHLAYHLLNTSSAQLPNVQRSRAPKPHQTYSSRKRASRNGFCHVVSSSSGLQSNFSPFKPTTLMLSGCSFILDFK